MIPVVSVDEMVAFDAVAMETLSQDELVRRAGYALAMGARRLLGTLSGRRVCVIAGSGSNGADGRVCAAVLTRRGAKFPPGCPDEEKPHQSVNLLFNIIGVWQPLP